MYIIGIDGGGTKTSCLIGDTKGNILSEGLSSSSNYQTVGIDYAKASILACLYEAMKKINIKLSDIGFIFLGLSGADLEVDFKILSEMCCEIFGPVPFKIVNDCWIGFRAGIKENFGIVTICGTGANTAGRGKDGKEYILRSLTYQLGNRGGGIDIAMDALHYAYRSEEGTGLKTYLETAIPESIGYKDLHDMIDPLRKDLIEVDKVQVITQLVFKLATEGDRVCQNILINMGHTLGEMASGVIKKLNLCQENFPITLIGGVFKGNNPLLVDEYTTTVHRAAPYARIEIAKLTPATGAYLLGLEEIKK